MVDLTRRSLLRTAGRAGAAAGLTALAGRGAWLAAEPAVAALAPALDREVRIGYLPITDASALLVAHERGFLAAAGLPSAKPVLFRSWDALAQALAVGEVDAVHLLMPFALQLRLGRQVPLKVVAWGHTNGSTLTVAQHVTRTEQLSCARLAVPAWWSVHSVLTQRILGEVGLRPVLGRPASSGTVELVVMAPADMVPALASGAIAGFTVADPFSAVAEAKGAGRVHRFLGDVWHDHACCAITVRADLIEQRPRAVQALTDGIVAAQAWLDAQPHRRRSTAVDRGVPSPAGTFDQQGLHPDARGVRRRQPAPGLAPRAARVQRVPPARLHGVAVRAAARHRHRRGHVVPRHGPRAGARRIGGRPVRPGLTGRGQHPHHPSSGTDRMSATTLDLPLVPARPKRLALSSATDAWWLPLAGIAAATGFWWLLTDVAFASRPLVAGFSPTLAVRGLAELAASGTLVDAAAASVFRLLAGLGVAFVLGVAGGVALGQLAWLESATRPVQLFLRMVSPLSWAPVAIIAFGVGTLPVVALVAAAAVWPILTATADGVRGVRSAHRQVARNLGATPWEVVRHVVVPAIRPNVLAGLRLALGLGWVVLVPAEMLGVTSGLGYAVLNAKDQLAFHHITALIIVIGTIGFALDVVARWVLATSRQRRDEGRTP